MHLLRNVILAIGLSGLTVGAFACGGGSKTEETTPATNAPAEGTEAAPAEGEAAPAEGEAAPADDTADQGQQPPAGEQPKEGDKK